jgi:hypothetical protein
MTAKKILVMLAGAAAVFLGWYFLRPKKAHAATEAGPAPAPMPPAAGGYEKPGSQDPQGDVDVGDITFSDPEGKVTGVYKTPDF